MARQFFGRRLDEFRSPGFSHEPRWHSTAAVKRIFSSGMKAALGARGVDVTTELLGSLPRDFSGWSSLAQDQYLEIRTLLSSYILCSQGDRMLMAHSVEGRFPFLDVNVAKLAATLPASYKLHVLDEKHVLKRAAARHVPEEIRMRTKQPYRAPDALSFVAPGVGGWLEEALSPDEIARAGVFDAELVLRLKKKMTERRDDAQVSHTDNMALVGAVSTQLLYRQVLHATQPSGDDVRFETFVDRSSSPSPPQPTRVR
jgi:asparagine synthase (glutamine-hydrolysing)